MSSQEPRPEESPESPEPKREPESPFLDEELFAELEVETAEAWASGLIGYQFESPFQYAFEPKDPEAVPVPENQQLDEQNDFDSSFFANNRVLQRVWDGRLTLRSGRRGGSVAKVQEALISFGLMLPKFGVDGKFGKETQKAVADFQRLNSLKVTGRVDSTTLQKLNETLKSIPSIRRAPVVRRAGRCVGQLEVFCPSYLRAREDGKVGFGTCLEAAELGNRNPDSANFRSRDTLWYKTFLPATKHRGKFRVHHIAKDSSGRIFHALPSHPPDPDWHRI